jgi:hypothetical protein
LLSLPGVRPGGEEGDGGRMIRHAADDHGVKRRDRMHGTDRSYAMRLASSLIVALMAVGCMPVVKPDRLVPMQTDDSYFNLLYVGSNEKYHYFERADLLLGEHYRVARADLKMPDEFPNGKGKYRLVWPGTLEKAMAN